MAVLKNIHQANRLKTMPASVDYIENPLKSIPGEKTSCVLRIINEPALARMAAFGYNGCSTNRILATEQMKLAQYAYQRTNLEFSETQTYITIDEYLKRNHKKAVPSYMKVSDDGRILIEKAGVAAYHLVMSFHESDKITSGDLRLLMDEFMSHEYFRNFLALAAPHHNTDNLHVHIWICNYSSDGCRKLCLSGTKLRELQRFLDRLCYKYGLSIVDSKEARLDPEHAKWIDSVIEEGKVTVWSLKKGEKENGQNSDNEVLRLIKYYKDRHLFIADGNYIFPIKKKVLKNGRTEYYAIKEKGRLPEKGFPEEKNRSGYTLSLFEKIFLLIYEVFRDFRNQRVTEESAEEKMRNDAREERIFSALRVARRLNVRTPEDLEERTEDIQRKIIEMETTQRYDTERVQKSQCVYDSVERLRRNEITEDEFIDRMQEYKIPPAAMSFELWRHYNAERALKKNAEFLARLYVDFGQAQEARETLYLELDWVKCMQKQRETVSLDHIIAQAETKKKFKKRETLHMQPERER